MKKLNRKWWLRGWVSTSVTAGETILESRAYQEGGTLETKYSRLSFGIPKRLHPRSKDEVEIDSLHKKQNPLSHQISWIKVICSYSEYLPEAKVNHLWRTVISHRASNYLHRFLSPMSGNLPGTLANKTKWSKIKGKKLLTINIDQQNNLIFEVADKGFKMICSRDKMTRWKISIENRKACNKAKQYFYTENFNNGN